MSKTSKNKKLLIACKPFLLFIAYLFSSENSMAQQKITPNDELIIKRKAVGLVKDLVYKYNQLLEADSEDRKQIIDNMLLPIDGNISIFVNDQVIIEDDFQTRANFASDKPSKRVDIYFQEICANYGREDNGEYKNEGKIIAFNNIRSSKIMAVSDNSPLFVKIFFDVSYEGIDKRTGTAFKQPCNRVAEIQAVKEKNSWSISILTIRFLAEYEADLSKNVLVENASSTPDSQKVLLSTKQAQTVKTPDLPSKEQPKSVKSFELPNYKKSSIFKVSLGVLSIGSLGYALKLNSEWKSKLNEIDKATLSGNYSNYLTAYDNASKFQSSQSIRNLCVGIAITSTIAEAYMFIRKPNKRKTIVLPSNNSLGLTLNYKF